VAPQRGYDEPAILSYAISSFCPTSADGLQVSVLELHRCRVAPVIPARRSAVAQSALSSMYLKVCDSSGQGRSGRLHSGGDRGDAQRRSSDPAIAKSAAMANSADLGVDAGVVVPCGRDLCTQLFHRVAFLDL